MSGKAPVAETEGFVTAKVAPDILLDSRLALYHQMQRWLAVADLHFGYEIRQRHQGGLFPLWGMEEIECRLLKLLAHHQPERLILCGDIMDFHGSYGETQDLVRRLREQIQTICIVGNHDRPPLRRRLDFVDSHVEEGFLFHHGHRFPEVVKRHGDRALGVVHVTGHFHPAHVFADGAGLRLKLPAFVQNQEEEAAHWILPAFSPWAGGTATLRGKTPIRVFPIHPQRIVSLG